MTAYLRILLLASLHFGEKSSLKMPLVYPIARHTCDRMVAVPIEFGRSGANAFEPPNDFVSDRLRGTTEKAAIFYLCPASG